MLNEVCFELYDGYSEDFFLFLNLFKKSAFRFM